MAKDLFHNNVKIALQKDGWKITHDPYQLRYGIADGEHVNFVRTK
jgi:XisH protein